MNHTAHVWEIAGFAVGVVAVMAFFFLLGRLSARSSLARAHARQPAAPIPDTAQAAPAPRQEVDRSASGPTGPPAPPVAQGPAAHGAVSDAHHGASHLTPPPPEPVGVGVPGSNGALEGSKGPQRTSGANGVMHRPGPAMGLEATGAVTLDPTDALAEAVPPGFHRVAETTRQAEDKSTSPGDFDRPLVNGATSSGARTNGARAAQGAPIPKSSDPASPPSAAVLAPGWRADPEGRSDVVRYWDGGKWTLHFARKTAPSQT